MPALARDDTIREARGREASAMAPSVAKRKVRLMVHPTDRERAELASFVHALTNTVDAKKREENDEHLA